MTLMYLILAIIALGILVFIHELGHYFVAKKMGMKVETFSIGFGRPLLKWRWQEVDWQLGYLPFGGYVKILGMEFSKKEKDQNIQDIYDIPNGFFSKAPWKRIMVAIAGPIANLLLALFLFTMIWLMGGREKSFSEYTHIVGWVQPQSELYRAGLRPGDILTYYNGNPYQSSKDLLYAAMLEGKKVELKGFHVDYENQKKTPFSYKIENYHAPDSPDGILTTGISSPASYLIYDNFQGQEHALIEGSPLVNSGIQKGDRLIWSDGELLFSLEQLSYLMNMQKAFLTVKRGDQIFVTRQPRLAASELKIPPYLRNELSDWQYEAGIKTRELIVLPYIVNYEGYIEAPLDFIDMDYQQQAFPVHPYSDLEKPLEAGDRILAVDGIEVKKGSDILTSLQTHKLQLMVEGGYKRSAPHAAISWKEGDILFTKGIHWNQIETLAKKSGLLPDAQEGSYRLLNPIEPKRADQFSLTPEAREIWQKNIEKRRAEIEKMRDREKRAQALSDFEKNQQKLMLGVALQDRKVEYNPNPIKLFANVFTETWQTLKSLLMGYLNPKWLSGPIGIVQVIHQGWQLGLAEALFWIGAISVNLGFLNLLPIPVLDGGYICLALWEMVTGRKLKTKTMEKIIIPFVVLLVGFLIFVTFQDLSRLF